LRQAIRAEFWPKRLHKSRDLVYAESVAEFLQGDAAPEPEFWGHWFGGVGSGSSGNH